MKMDKKWIPTKKIISILLNIWANPQYKVIFIFYFSLYDLWFIIIYNSLLAI